VESGEGLLRLLISVFSTVFCFLTTDFCLEFGICLYFGACDLEFLHFYKGNLSI